MRRVSHTRLLARPISYLDNNAKQRYYPLRGFGSFASAARCCTGFAEQRPYFRHASRVGEHVALAERRCLSQDRWAAVLRELAIA